MNQILFIHKVSCLSIYICLQYCPIDFQVQQLFHNSGFSMQGAHHNILQVHLWHKGFRQLTIKLRFNGCSEPIWPNLTFVLLVPCRIDIPTTVRKRPQNIGSIEFEETENFEISADFLLQWGILALVLGVFVDLRVTFLNIMAKADRWEFPSCVESERIAIIPFFSIHWHHLPVTRNASSGFNPLFIRTLSRILYPCS